MWDGTPWFVEGGAQHSANVARALAYMALRGQEGVRGALDLAVLALSTPGAAVRVSPGECSILNRAAGISKEMYVGKVVSDDEVPVAATDSTGGRSDMVIARVENPWLSGEPWAQPADPAVGPYIFSRVIQGVPAGAKTLADAGLTNQSAIPLARVDIPASTATITQDMIVDLRSVASPLSEGWSTLTDTPAGSVLEGTTAGPTAYRTWPAEATWNVAVPPWATSVQLEALLTPYMGSPGCWGDMKFVLNGVSSAVTSFDDNFFTSATAGGQRTVIRAAAVMTVPAAIRGTTVNLHLEARQQGTTALPSGDVTANVRTNVSLSAAWKQSPAYT